MTTKDLSAFFVSAAGRLFFFSLHEPIIGIHKEYIITYKLSSFSCLEYPKTLENVHTIFPYFSQQKAAEYLAEMLKYKPRNV